MIQTTQCKTFTDGTTPITTLIIGITPITIEALNCSTYFLFQSGKHMGSKEVDVQWNQLEPKYQLFRQFISDFGTPLIFFIFVYLPSYSVYFSFPSIFLPDLSF